MNKKINIIIVDDSMVFLEALSFVLNKTPYYNIIATYNEARKLIVDKKFYNADLLLSDIEMPTMNGFELANKINYFQPNLRMMALTMHCEDIYLSELISAGFRGYIYKPEISKKIHQSIKLVLANRLVFPDYLKI